MGRSDGALLKARRTSGAWYVRPQIQVHPPTSLPAPATPRRSVPLSPCTAPERQPAPCESICVGLLPCMHAPRVNALCPDLLGRLSAASPLTCHGNEAGLSVNDFIASPLDRLSPRISSPPSDLQSCISACREPRGLFARQRAPAPRGWRIKYINPALIPRPRVGVRSYLPASASPGS